MTNREKSRLLDLPQDPSYLDFLKQQQPNTRYLAKIMQGLMECYPEEKSDKIIGYLEQWKGVKDKIGNKKSEIVRIAQSSFIKSTQSNSSSNKLKFGSQKENKRKEAAITLHSQLLLTGQDQTQKYVNQHPDVDFKNVQKYVNPALKLPKKKKENLRL